MTNPALKEKLINELGLQKREQIKKIDQQLLDIAQDVSRREGEIKTLSSKINKEAREARKKAKANMTILSNLFFLNINDYP